MNGSLLRFARLVIFAGLSIHFYGRIGDHPQGIPLEAGVNAALFGMSLALFLIALGAIVGSRVERILSDTRVVDSYKSAYSSQGPRVDPQSERREAIWREGVGETGTRDPLKVSDQERHYVWADSLSPIEPVEEASR
jgi:hypothetical protein